MNQKLIKLNETHYIAVDGSKIEEGDWYYDSGDENFICKAFKHTTNNYNRFKITHSFGKHLEYIENRPLSEVEEVIYGYSVEEMALSKFPDKSTAGWIDSFSHSERRGYVEGFNAHKELVKDKLFAEINKQIDHFKHDLKESTSTVDKQMFEGALFGLERLRQSLLPPTEWDVEFVNGKLKLI